MAVMFYRFHFIFYILFRHFEAVEARLVRSSYSTFVDILALATKTAEEFGQGTKF